MRSLPACSPVLHCPRRTSGVCVFAATSSRNALRCGLLPDYFVHFVLGTAMSPVLVERGDDDVIWSLAVPLWLPYVVFTVVLLSLIVVSFARFHALRGAQYRNSSTHLDTPRLTWTHLYTPGHTSIPRPARSSVPQQTAGRRTDIRTQRAQERVGLTHYQSINQSIVYFQSGPSNKITSGSTGGGEQFTGDQ